MKLKIRNTLILLALIFSFSACSLDEDPKLNVSAQPELNTPENTIYDLASLYNAISGTGDELNTLRAQFEATTVQTFSWTKGQFRFASAGNYQVEVSNTADFVKIVSLGSAYNVFLPVTVKTLNQAALNFEPADNFDPITLYVRVKCSLNDVTGSNAQIIYSSNVLKITVTPYETQVEYPKIYIVGTPNGWDINGTSCPLVCKTGDGVYMGVFKLDNEAKSGSSNMFRFYTELGNWDKNSLGSQVDDSPVNISKDFKDGAYQGAIVNGKGSFEMDFDGTYTITVDTKKMTVKIEEGGSDPSTWTYLYMVGNVNGWSVAAEATKGQLVCKTGDNIYKGTLTLPAAAADNPFSFFRFYSALTGDWDTGSIGTTTGGDFPIEFEDGVGMAEIKKDTQGSFKVTPGTYDVTVNTNDMLVTLSTVTQKTKK